MTFSIAKLRGLELTQEYSDIMDIYIFDSCYPGSFADWLRDMNITVNITRGNDWSGPLTFLEFESEKAYLAFRLKYL
jgi:hypothetical protein